MATTQPQKEGVVWGRTGCADQNLLLAGSGIRPLKSSMAETVAGPSTTAQPEPADVVMIESSIAGKTPPERPLNVRDALSYLNDVKVQFQHKPDVYNLFLDTMRDYRGQL